MKTSFLALTCAAALLIPFSSAADDEKGTKKSTGFGTGIYPTKEGKINVYIDKVDSNSPTLLLLKNSKGEVIYREVIKKSYQKFGRRLNIDDLEPGKYEIKVTVHGESQSTSFQLSEEKIERVLKVE
jgi:hypothetical protein